LRVAAALHRGAQPDSLDLKVLNSGWLFDYQVVDASTGRVTAPSETHVSIELEFLTNELRIPLTEVARDLLSWEVDYWLQVGGVRPTFAWPTKGRPAIAFEGRGLWGVIARQLAFRCLNDRPMATCSECGDFFSPTRKPRTGSRSWCSRPLCQKRGRWRAAKRDERARRQR
jgi:hypothetical protein